MWKYWLLFKRIGLGNQERIGLIWVLIVYAVLINVAYLYLNPLIYMISTMFKGTSDLLDPTVRWIPRTLEWGNLKHAWQGLNFPSAFKNSAIISGLGALFHVASCSIAGYAFARFKFPGRNLLFGALLFSFLVPPQTVTIPLYILMRKLELLGTPFAVIGPALFGHGIRGALFVIIFRQFFRTLPKEMDEAARIDGAGAFRIYARVMLPMAKPAILTVFLFSLVWHWNDTFMSSLMVGNWTPLSLSLTDFNQRLSGTFDGKPSFDLNETVRMAASFLIILPLLIVYSFAQRWFVQGVERSGLVE